MKLKELNIETMGEIPKGNPAVNINKKNGYIRLNKAAVALMKLKKTDRIQIVHDEDAGDLYFEILKIRKDLNYILAKTEVLIFSTPSLQKSY